MKKKSVTHDDMIDADRVDLKKLSSFPIVNGIVWEHPDRSVSCGLLLYIPLEKRQAEKILKFSRKFDERS